VIFNCQPQVLFECVNLINLCGYEYFALISLKTQKENKISRYYKDLSRFDDKLLSNYCFLSGNCHLNIILCYYHLNNILFFVLVVYMICII